jgi:hypothetical protein
MRFRPPDGAGTLAGVPLTAEAVRRLLADVIAPRHFFIGSSVQLHWQHVPGEECSWEVFQGRLLDPVHTRRQATFESWNVHLVEDGLSAEPLLALKLDAAGGLVHVVRGIDCYAWEGYDAGGGVFLSRQRRRWVRELSTTLELGRFADLDQLRDELMCGLFHAVVGTSRLPLASVEAPLPAFSFGELFYCYRPDTPEPLLEMPQDGLNPLERVKWLETVSHRLPSEDLDRAAATLGQRGLDWLVLLRQMFNEVSLSPWTGLVERTLAVLQAWQRCGLLTAEVVLDFLRGLLCQVGRHLTAYDLTTYHYRGANYPDALLLNAVLKDYLRLAEGNPDLVAGDDREGRLRRRALRQGWLLRRFYEGHLVPDAPTSPGENLRVLPARQPRVPEEQILQPGKRRRRLFANDPLPGVSASLGALLRQSIRDLAHPDELRELGLALYVDRPLGDAKANAEPDRTPLLSSLAFSRSLARQRLLALRKESWLHSDSASLDACLARLDDGPPMPGIPVEQIGPSRRAAAVSLTDARRVAGDFVFLRTTAGTLADLLTSFQFGPVLERFGLDLQGALVARAPSGDSILIYDKHHRPRLEFIIDSSQGYAVRANREYPVAGLLVRAVWEGDPPGRNDLTQEPILVLVTG